MEEFWILILVSFIATNSPEKAESVQLEELPLQTFDELFVDEWWDKDEAENLKTPPPTNFGQNVHHQIDRQNAQIGQIEPNSTDLNPPLKESDHSDNAKNGEEQNEKIAEDERKQKFEQMKAELKRDGFKSSFKNQIDETVAKELGLNFVTIYKWKRKLGQTASNKHPHSKQKELMKSYYEIKDKNPKNRDEDIAKMLKIGSRTLVRWKKQFKQQQFHPNSVNGHFVEENAAANVQEIENSNLGSI
uniref:Transposase n=1 Tax=Globodera rostochiensis TaxID=31243 RepID=A0A914HR75_GLORO